MRKDLKQRFGVTLRGDNENLQGLETNGETPGSFVSIVKAAFLTKTGHFKQENALPRSQSLLRKLRMADPINGGVQ